jgi:DNA-binding NtrC family response regulator
MRTVRSVLVIDDNLDTLETLTALLNSLGVEHVTPASSAEAAKKILKKQRFSMIVADYRLEGMDGVEFLEDLRAGGDLTPVIMVSGTPDRKGVNRATRQPRVDFFAKPFRVADLMGAMDRMAA